MFLTPQPVGAIVAPTVAATIASRKNKKGELSQRWLHDAAYIWVPGKFSGVPDYAHGYF